MDGTIKVSETTGADQIIDTLKTEANTILAAAVGSTPLQGFSITSKGNMPYVWQNPANLKFNAKTYDWIDSSLKSGAMPREFAPGTNFTNLYLQQATNIVWSLSKADQADQAVLNDAASNATQQQAAVLNAWKSAFGSIPAGNTPIDDISSTIAIDWANPSTTLTEIQNSINLDALLNNVPASGKPVIPVFVNWLNALGASVPLQNQVTMYNGYLKRAIQGIQAPTSANGGLALDSGKVAPAYAVANQMSDILNALKNTSNAVELSMTVSRSTTSEFQVNISGSTGFSIPIMGLITVGVGAEANYFASNIATTSNKTTVDMSFTGVNLVNYGPVDFTQAGNSENWFWMDPINAAIINGYPAKDVSGFKFARQPDTTDFSDKGPFGYLAGAAISNYPTIKIVVESANYQEIQKTFQQSAKSTVSFLGIPLASASESTYSNNVTVDESSSTVTITLTPPASLVAGNAVDSVGWILGVQPMFPAS